MAKRSLTFYKILKDPLSMIQDSDPNATFKAQNKSSIPFVLFMPRGACCLIGTDFSSHKRNHFSTDNNSSDFGSSGADLIKMPRLCR
jgi:hypothetical protein